jgi:hypothetical protein
MEIKKETRDVKFIGEDICFWDDDNREFAIEVIEAVEYRWRVALSGTIFEYIVYTTKNHSTVIDCKGDYDLVKDDTSNMHAYYINKEKKDDN